MERESHGASLDRRQLLGAGLLATAAVATPLLVWQRMRHGDRGEASDRQRAMLREVAQLTIPRTDTPGAADVGTHDFVILALAHGLDGTRQPAAGESIPASIRYYQRQDGSLDHLQWLENALDTRAGGDFLAAPAGRKAAALAAIDAEAFASRDSQSPWAPVKALILTGYYTSEAGGSQELRYELVPGRYDPDIPLAATDRAWSSDWTAVEFG
jgi:hypothetical protein